MRPKKIILCVNDNEQELSIMRYMLEINGYRALKADSGADAIAVFKSCAVELVIADYEMPVMNGAKLIDELKKIAAHIPMILMGDLQKMGSKIHMADAFLDKKRTPQAELLERIKVMSQRKRGPRKGIVRAVPKKELVISA